MGYPHHLPPLLFVFWFNSVLRCLRLSSSPPNPSQGRLNAPGLRIWDPSPGYGNSSLLLLQDCGIHILCPSAQNAPKMEHVGPPHPLYR